MRKKTNTTHRLLLKRIASVLWRSTRMRPVLCRLSCVFVCLFTVDADKRVNCVYTIAECRHSCSIPTAPVLSLSLRLLGLLPWTHSPQPAYSASVVLRHRAEPVAYRDNSLDLNHKRTPAL